MPSPPRGRRADLDQVSAQSPQQQHSVAAWPPSAVATTASAPSGRADRVGTITTRQGALWTPFAATNR